MTLPTALNPDEDQTMLMLGRMPEGERLKQLLKRQLDAADEMNRRAFGVPLHQSQGHAQVLQSLLERLEGKPRPQALPRRKFVEEPLFGP